MQMKKVVIRDVRHALLADVAEPQPRENWVLVKVHAAPMCAEYKQFIAGGQHEYLGHEAAGEVVAIAQPGKLKVGDRVVAMPLSGCGTCTLCLRGDYIYCTQAPDYVACTGSPEGRGTMAQYILKPDWLLPRIPKGMPYERAALACCALGPSFGALEAIGASAYDTVLNHRRRAGWPWRAAQCALSRGAGDRSRVSCLAGGTRPPNGCSGSA